MSGPPRWSVGAFAQRVRMGESGIWVVVEGRDHDRPYYDKLMRATPSAKGRKLTFRLAEQIEVDTISSGGKTHVVAIFNHMQARNLLASKNRSGASVAVFALDRDRDDFTGSIVNSDHVLYTHGTDVESDILMYSDIWEAVAAAYGIDSAVTDRIEEVVGDPIDSLYALWHDWIRLTLIALHCGMPKLAQPGTFSKVNSDTFGEVDAGLVSELTIRIRSAVDGDSFEKADERARKHMSRYGVRLLKGRWVARYLRFLVEKHLGDEVIRSKVATNSVIDTALASIDRAMTQRAGCDARLSSVLQPVSRVG